MSTTRVRINPTVLQWARERLFSTVEEAVQEWAPYSGAQLKDWESGARQPTYLQAQDLANRLRLPFGYLLLSAPPKEDLTVPDLRVAPGELSQRPSPDLLDVIYDAQLKQWSYTNELYNHKLPTLRFLERFNKNSEPEKIAADIAATLDIDHERRTAKALESFFRGLVRRTEDSGVLVLRSRVADNNNYRPLRIDEFRGFALTDDFAPIIFINGCDERAAQVLTLVFELAHIWIGEPGVSNLDFNLAAFEQPGSIEKLCFSVAVEMLLLSKRVLQDRVSPVAALRQAYGEYYAEEQTETYEGALNSRLRTPRSENMPVSLYDRNSKTFTKALIAAVAADRIGLIEAARLLGVRGKKVQQMVKRSYADS